MRIQCVQIDEMIGVAQPLQITDGSFRSLVGEQVIGSDHKPVKATRCPIIDPAALPHEIRRGISACTHALGERDICGVEEDGKRIVEDLIVVRIHPRFNGRERRIGILRCGEVLIEDRSLREEAGRIRHPFGEMLP